MEMSHYLRIVRRSWILLVALAISGTMVAGAYWLAKPRTYTATSEVYVSTGGAKTVDDFSQGAALTQQLVKSYVDVAQSPLVLRPVIERLGLKTDVDTLAEHVSAQAPIDTVVIRITATDPSAERAAGIADAVVAELRGAVTDLSPDATAAAATIKLTPIRSAVAPRYPDGPSLLVTLLLGLLAGLVLGLVVGYIRDRVDTKVRTPDGLRRAVEPPLLGTTHVEPRGSSRLVTDGTSPAIDAARALAVNLEFLAVPAGGRSIVVTSSVAAEGKSTTAVNLAVMLADAGQKVLLIDGDLHRPSVSTYLGLEGGVGLTDVLVGRVARDKAIQRWGSRELDVLTAGSTPPNPSELIRSPALEELIEDTKGEYDIVLIDTPPLLAVADGAVLAKRSAGALLVAAVNTVRYPQVVEALSVLDQIGATCLGVVATMTPGRRPAEYGYRGATSGDRLKPPRRQAPNDGATPIPPDAAAT